MKEKIKEFLKKYLIGFILGFVSVGIVVVYAETYFPSNDVTYDNSESGLSSTDVQGAIDELYGVCTAKPSAGEQIIEDAGLEKDPYECRYFFTGANPNNYVTLIVRTASIRNQYWDISGSNNWSRPSTLNTYLNGTYYNDLNSIAKNQLIASDFSIGPVNYRESNMSTQINNENSSLWNGMIALPTVSEYIRSNSNINCKTFLGNNSNYNTCKNTTWMYLQGYDWWTLSFNPDNFEYGYYVHKYSNVDSFSVKTHDLAVRPALYLSSEVNLSGSGTQSNPYVVS